MKLNPQFDGVIFLNEVQLNSEGWAHIAPFGDYRGEAMMRKDGVVKKFPAIQRLDRTAMDALVANFKSPLNRIKNLIFGCEIFNGHPDRMDGGKEYADRGSKGVIMDLEVREDGLWGKPVFSNAASDLFKNKKLCFSARWSSDHVGEEKGMEVFRPSQLKSVGLTERPNLPVHFVNEQNNPKNTMDKILLINLLTGLSVEIANDATDEQIQAAVTKLGERVKLAESKTVELANDKSKLEGVLQDEKLKAKTLTTQLDTAKSDFANERKARITESLDAAIVATRITAAQRPQWQKRLEADFANEFAALQAETPKLKTTTATAGHDHKANDLADGRGRQELVNLTMAEIANEKGLDLHKDYDLIYNEAQRRQPEVFKAMQHPVIKKKN